MHLLQIFFNPAQTFEQLRQKKWSWIVPAILLIVLSVASVSLLLSKFSAMDILEESMRQSGQEMPAQGLDQAAGFMSVMMYAGPVISVPVMILFFGVILLAIVKATSGETSYPMMLNAAAWSMWPWSVISSVLMMVMVMTAPDVASASIQNPVPLNLAYFLDKEAVGAGLSAILSGVNLLNFYFMYLLALGASKLSDRVSMGKVLTPIVVLYIVWTVGKAGFATIFG